MKQRNRGYFVFHFLFYFLCSMCRLGVPQSTTVAVRVGVVLDLDSYIGRMGLECVKMALSDFYAENSRYRTRLVLTSRNSKGGVVGAAAAALDLLKNVKVEAIIGPMYSTQATFLIALGDKAQVPIITFSATSPSLSSIRSPYFIRATLADSSQVQAIAAIIKAYGWREVVPVFEQNEFGEGVIPYLTDALEEVNARVPYRSAIPPQATDDQIVAELYKLMTMQTRVFVVHMAANLGSRLFSRAKEIGMMSEDYVWIVTDGISYELNSMDPSILKLMQGIVGVYPHTPRTRELDNFSDQYKSRRQHNNSMNPSEELNIYGLWAYDSAIALAMAAEKALVNNTTTRKNTVPRGATDLEPLGVSSVGPHLIHALSSTTFKGLAGTFQLSNAQLLSPPYGVVNLASSGVQTVGYWTKDNGIVRDLSITNDDTKKYSTSKSNLGSITWPGGRAYPSKGWVIPTNGKKLRVGVPVRSGFTEFVRITWGPDDLPKVEGYCIEVFDAVMKALPYGVPYEYVPFATPDRKKAGTYNELTYQVYLGNYDIAAGDITVLANRSKYVDFTLPYMPSGVSMVVPVKEDKSKNAWVFVKPLTWELWLTSFCSFVFIAFLIWILEHRINEEFRGPFWSELGAIFMFAFSTMVFAQKEKVYNNLSRIVLIIWFLVVLILTQSYTASLTSMLTVQQLQPAVSDVQVLLQNKDFVGYSKLSFIFGLLKGMGFDESRLVPFSSAEELDTLFSKGGGNGGISAAFVEIPYLKLFLSKYCSKYVMVDPTYKADGFGFVFPIGSPLVYDVSRAILNVTESIQMMEMERKWLGDATKCVDSSAINPPQSLGLRSFWGLFSIVAIAGIFSLVVHLARFLRGNWRVLEQSDAATAWKKIVLLLQTFDKKDLTSHTFRGLAQAPGTSPFSQGYPHSEPPSPAVSSPSRQRIPFHLEPERPPAKAAANPKDETTKQELELASHSSAYQNS